jgi:NodT family efflux transporter outer membrane factor (OMF) lipoprotein
MGWGGFVGAETGPVGWPGQSKEGDAMFRIRALGRIVVGLSAASLIALAGCTSLRDYVHNGFKVGPNYGTPCAPVAEHWIDEADIHAAEGQDLSRWWTIFHDPTLDRLILCAYQQNLTLREAAFRILQARALLGIARGELFPETQNVAGSYQRIAVSRNSAQGAEIPAPFFDQWTLGFNLAWELDFWGRLRRAMAAADRQLDASVEDYDQVLVTLLGDVASNYVQIRTDQERLRYLRQNVEILELVLKWTERREKVGFKTLPLDVHQTGSNLEQTAAGISQLELDLRRAENRLCVLMGMPPADLRKILGEDRIPEAPPELAIGIPAELVRRRPDVRRAERLAAAQSEQIGIAEAELYPAISITGTLGWQAQRFPDLFSGRSLAGNIGPSFQWNLLNYGRIVNNVRYQEARFQELVAAYQQTALQAAEEAEDGLATFLQAQERTRHLEKSVALASAAVKDMFLPTALGQPGFDFNRFALIEQNRVVQQDLLAQSRGQIAQGLIQVYRALGGGWEIRLESAEVPPLPEVPPSIAPEGAAELQALRDLLEAPTGEPVPKPAPQPKPPAAPPQP